MKTLFKISLVSLSFAFVTSASAQVNITTYGGGVPTRYTTITPTYGGYRATTSGGGLPTTYSTITVPYGYPATTGVGTQGIESAPQHALSIPTSLVTPATPLDYGGLLNSYQKGYQSSASAIYQREANENIRQQTQLLQQRARIEAEQYREDLEARRQTREAELAEAKLRKELAEAKLAELRIKQAEEKGRQDAAEKIRRQEAQIRFERIKEQVQKESAESKAKQNIVTLTPEQIAEYNRITSGTSTSK